MRVPAKGRTAYLRAKAYLESRELAVGEPVDCAEAYMPPHYTPYLLPSVPERLESQFNELFTRLSFSQKFRTYWQMGFRHPPEAGPGDAHIWSWIYVYDDGRVALKRHARIGGIHAFIAKGQFQSDTDLRAYFDPTYDAQGCMVPSPFMREIGLSDYEPGRITAIRRDRPVRASRLLAHISRGKEWAGLRPGRTLLADTAVCVFTPARVAYPRLCSLRYLGGFEYFIESLIPLPDDT